MIELDCRGLLCPQPIINVGMALRQLKSNETIILISDDPATQKDLGAWSRMTGNKVRPLGAARFQITKS